MVDFTLTQVLAAVAGVAVKTRQTMYRAVVTDTRQLTEGSLFVALNGEKFDGHDFVRQAIAGGATGVIVSVDYTVSKLETIEATVIKVADTRLAYQLLARAYRCRFTLPVIAITGSNGKTTTKDLTAAVLGAKWKVLKTQANFNNEIGLPLTLLQLDRAHAAAVVEMGMRGSGQIKQLANLALPTIGIVTNVGETHMELLGSMDNIAAAKCELVEAIPATGTVILNTDNHYVKAMARQARCKVVTFGCSDGCDVRAEQIISCGQQTKFTCVYQAKSYVVYLPLVGQHNVYNALAAIAVGLEFGFSMTEIQTGLVGFVATPMRMQFEQVGDYTVINDAYNASPASMTAAIETLTKVAAGRKIAVLGDMLELGETTVAAHRAVGAVLAAKAIDAVVTIGALGAEIAKSAKENGIAVVVACIAHDEAALALQKIVRSGDTLLVKGSRGMQMEKVIALLK